MSSAQAGPDDGPAFAVPTPVDDATEIWLIRHGETEWSRSGQHTGRTDIPLTEFGERQARALRTELAGVHPALVLSSPRQRARHTAELAGLTVDAIDDDLAEWDYGDYEGITTAEIRKSVPGWSLWTHGVPNGESAEDVTKRADRVLQRAVGSMARGPVLLIAHGHISRVIGARWIGLNAVDGGRLALDTAATSVLGAQYGDPLISRWNQRNPAV